MSTWTTPATWTAGATVTAAQMNTETRDHMNWLKGAFTQINVTSDVAASNLGRGTTFPVSPATNDRYFRTDKGVEYFWDGTRWSSVTEYVAQFVPRTAQPVAVSVTLDITHYGHAATSILITAVAAEWYVATTNNSTNRWLINFFDGSTSYASTVSDAPGPNAWGQYLSGALARTVAWTASNHQQVDVSIPVGAPGSITVNAAIRYRVIAT